MDIGIYIHRVIGSDGKASAYWPEVHWTMDDQDSIAPDKMDMITKTIQRDIAVAFASLKSDK